MNDTLFQLVGAIHPRCKERLYSAAESEGDHADTAFTLYAAEQGCQININALKKNTFLCTRSPNATHLILQLHTCDSLGQNTLLLK